MKKVFVIDWVLVPLFAVSVFTGFGLHIAGHGDSHALWHNWDVAHIVSSLLFTVFVLWHVKMHWGWYKGLFRTGPGRRRKSSGCQRSRLRHRVVALPHRDCGGSPLLRAHSQEDPGAEEILIGVWPSGFWGSPANRLEGTQDNVGALKFGPSYSGRCLLGSRCAAHCKTIQQREKTCRPRH